VDQAVRTPLAAAVGAAVAALVLQYECSVLYKYLAQLEELEGYDELRGALWAMTKTRQGYYVMLSCKPITATHRTVNRDFCPLLEVLKNKSTYDITSPL
jgi:hypothetical protein